MLVFIRISFSLLLPPLPLTLLVFLALHWMFCISAFRMETVAAPLRLRDGLLLLVRTSTFAQLLGLLEQLVEIEFSDNVLL